MKGALSWPFLRLYLLTLLYFSANSILNVIIPLKGESAGATNTAIGVIMGAYLFTTMFLRPWAGRIIQQVGPVQVLRIILILNGLALVLYTVSGLEGYFFARMLQGACTAFFSMSLQLGIIDSLPDQDRSQGISMYSLCAALPGVIGPLLAVGMWESQNGVLFPAAMIGIAVLTGAVGFSARIGNGEQESKQGREDCGERYGERTRERIGKHCRKQREQFREPLGEQNRKGHGDSTAAKRGSMLHSFGQLFTNRQLFRCCVLMLGASIIFGAVTTFIPLYAPQIDYGNAAVYLMLQAGTLVAARFFLRKKIPSDGIWHTPFVVTILFLLTAAALCISAAQKGGGIVFYAGAVMMGIAQALLYPALTAYLTFVLPKAERNVLIGWFIATADLGVSMGGVVFGPVADVSSFPVVYLICAALGALLLSFAYERRKTFTRP